MYRALVALLTWPLAAAASDAGTSLAHPLLEPLAPPQRQLSSWDEAVQLWSAGSGDLAIAAEELVRAAGAKRQALGQPSTRTMLSSPNDQNRRHLSQLMKW
jgi:hypothetical protein